MEQPRNIAIEGDQVAGQAYIPRAVAMLRRLSQRVELGNVQTASDFVRLAENAYLYATVAGTIRKAVIVVDPVGSTASQVPQFVTPAVPDFYSGAVLGGTIPTPPVTIPPTPKRMASFWPTAACRKFFNTLLDAAQPVSRLTVLPYDEFSGDLANPKEDGAVWSQYYRLKPTMYSGLMRQVVQLLMGYGKQEKESIYDKASPAVGRKPRKRSTPPTGYQREVASNGTQIRYDWRWYRTHGIAVGRDNTLWLVEIGSTRGVIAMPLPMNATSKLAAFRDKLDTMGDDAGQMAWDALGGFPTGESFPATALESWIRAGRIVRIATADDMQPFYQHGPFSSALGWAFNVGGTEAHNTCVSYDDDGFQTAYHYAVPVNIGELHQVTTSSSAADLRAKFNALTSDERYGAVMFKIGRIPDIDVQSYLRRTDPPAFLFEELDALVVEPMAVATGGLREMTRGRLYKKGRLAQYDLKFPDYELGYLVSWDMQPGTQAAFTGKCDTTVHVFFVGNQLKYVKFFNDPQTKPWATSDNDSDGCEVMGTFTYTTESGGIGLPTMVYTGDFDDRVELKGGRTITTRKGKSLGYSKVSANDDIVQPQFAHISRDKRFQIDSRTESWGGEGLASAMVVPFDDRCAYYYALAKGAAAHSVSTSSAYKYVTDPNSATTWRNFPGYTGRWGGDGTSGNPWYLISAAQHPSGCGPVTARTVLAPGSVYSPSACGDFADAGPWLFTCDNADAKLYEIPEPPLTSATNVSDNNKMQVTAYLMNEGGFSPLLTISRTSTTAGYENPWFLMSPNPESFQTQYAEDTHNALGDSRIMRYSAEPNGPVLTIGSPQPPGMASSNTTFIGAV